MPCVQPTNTSAHEYDQQKCARVHTDTEMIDSLPVSLYIPTTLFKIRERSVAHLALPRLDASGYTPFPTLRSQPSFARARLAGPTGWSWREQAVLASQRLV
eukprot:6184946-Pleurochrysis_carterae.AAC.1